MAESPYPRATAMRFTKMHGAGNDFVVLDLRDGTPPPDATLAAALADRHRGVGCDQILTIEAPRSVAAVAGYRIWNSDGSPSQQCGNGARCVAAWLVRDGGLSAATAIERLRRVDPAYVQTEVQEAFLHQFEDDLMRRLL